MFHRNDHAAVLAGILVACSCAIAWAQGDLMIYPKKGQSPEQMGKDRYECHVWAVQQSGFDPSMPQQVQAAPSTSSEPARRPLLGGAARGAAAGAAIGAIAGDAGKGAAIGATAGGLKRGAENIDRRRAAQSMPPPQNNAGNDAYRRAIKACLEGRDYSVN
ncbi:MAG: glycine zipper domain-containing protein [Gammaproteobacteria bacterium]